MFPHDILFVGREVYNERLQAAEMDRRIARNRRENGGSLSDRLAVQIGDMLINLGNQIKQRDWQTNTRSGRA